MTKEEQVELYFKQNPSLTVIYGTENGRFFLERGDRQKYFSSLEKNTDKPVDYTKQGFKHKETRTELPEDFPGYEVLTHKGLRTIEEVKAHPDLTSIKGIGSGTINQISEYLNNYNG